VWLSWFKAFVLKAKVFKNTVGSNPITFFYYLLKLLFFRSIVKWHDNGFWCRDAWVRILLLRTFLKIVAF
jgi:hypothetical protein